MVDDPCDVNYAADVARAAAQPGVLAAGVRGVRRGDVRPCYAYARRRAPWWATLSMTSGAVFVALFALTTLGFSQHPHLVGAAGLLR
ncbi:hypothetical protein Pmi06nite_77650 [Planotetraspora mira]|uniref:Uncharacterized protein n=1 Tax=Planotetraspora mira TaxID=58121 RepID=A0A8J3XFB3_9ACTN|nr:hypothetical protein Pmi06nite_77650 [Planotetraspora mira]